jgi:FixJ family two-component response regulator
MSLHARGHVFLVDDNPDIRYYLADLLKKVDYSIEQYADATEFLRQSMDVSPAVLVLDVRMPGMSGVELQTRLAGLGRHTPIIFISGESQTQEIIQAMKGGAIEFLWKPFQIQTLIDAIDRGLALDEQRRDMFIRTVNMRRKISELSAREKQVFLLMLQGQGNKGIGEILNIQADTIKKHRANILQKMQAHQLADLMLMSQGMDIAGMVQQQNHAD